MALVEPLAALALEELHRPCVNYTQHAWRRNNSVDIVDTENLIGRCVVAMFVVLLH